jgi:hypothetical protein
MDRDENTRFAVIQFFLSMIPTLFCPPPQLVNWMHTPVPPSIVHVRPVIHNVNLAQEGITRFKSSNGHLFEYHLPVQTFNFEGTKYDIDVEVFGTKFTDESLSIDLKPEGSVDSKTVKFNGHIQEIRVCITTIILS